MHIQVAAYMTPALPSRTTCQVHAHCSWVACFVDEPRQPGALRSGSLLHEAEGLGQLGDDTGHEEEGEDQPVQTVASFAASKMS